MARKNKEEVLREFKAEFLADFAHHRKWLSEIRDDERFYDGEQWTAQEKAELEERGQPVVTLNRVKPRIDSITGAEMGRPIDMKAFPRGLRDFSKASHITEALRYAEYHANFDSIENEAFRRQLVAGLAWYELVDKWDRVTFDHDVGCKLWSAHDVLRDRFSTEVDLSDCRRLHKTHFVREDELKLLFPGRDRAIDAAFLTDPGSSARWGGRHREYRPDQYRSPEAEDVPGPESLEAYGHFVKSKEREVRLVTTFYRVPFTERFLAIPAQGTQRVTDWEPADIKKLQQTYRDAVEFTDMRFELNVVTYIWNEVLEHKENIVPWDTDARYPFVMVPGMEFAERKRKGQYVGLVRGMKDPNKEVNKRRSKMLHLINTNQIIMEEGAVENPVRARQEVDRPDGIVVKRQGFEFQIQRNTDLAQSQFTLLQEAKAEVDNVGVRAELQGASRATSGRDFQLRHEAASQPVRPYLKNLRDAKKRFFLLALDRIQQYWVAPRLVKITDDPDAASVELNQVTIDPVTGNVVVVNNLSMGKYDIILEEVPENVNLQSEAYREFVNLAQIMAQQGQPVPVDMLIELSPFPRKQKLLERLAAQNARPAAIPQENGLAVN